MFNKYFFILVMIPMICFSQENTKLDSLNQEITKLEKQIEEIKSKIKSEIVENGFLLEARKKYTFSTIVLKDIASKKPIDTIAEGAKIRILNKESGYYKVKYGSITGYIDIYDITLEFNPYTNSFDEVIVDKKKISNTSSYKKTLDYSKPIHVRGHYRTTKSGKRVWVRPHTRKHKN